jgi:hypothetical protein
MDRKVGRRDGRDKEKEGHKRRPKGVDEGN